VRVITWKKTDSKTTTLTLVAQSDPELKYLNHLILEGKAMASGDSLEAIVNLKEGKSSEDYKVFLSTKLHFQVEQES
jgi:hypothetical protein